MDTTQALIVIAAAGILHATFQLSVSVLTLLSGHTFGRTASKNKLLKLSSTYLLGSAVMTLLLVSFATLVAHNIFGVQAEPTVWAIVSGLVVGVGLSVWLFYFRRSSGTILWIPRQIAEYLHDRTKHTNSGVEAFALGTMTMIGELLFTAAPLTVASLTLIGLNPSWQLFGLGVYVVTSLLPLVAMWMLIGGGHKVSELQDWREKNKYFMQFVAGSGLIILGIYGFINQVLSA